MIPTWSYVKDSAGLYVNMFVGSKINVGQVAGTGVEVVQKTDYPWKGTVSITVNPEEAKTFSMYVRIPNRTTSKLYKDSPAVHGVKRFAVNGEQVTPAIEKGYAVVTREWKAGDRIELELPMEPQRVVADARIKADDDMVALKYGPLIYNVEAADNPNVHLKLGAAPLRTEWEPNLLGGVVAITGKWADGSDLTAVPNYARMNRVGPPHAYPGEEDADSGPGKTKAGNGSATDQKRSREPVVESKVWI
jgi:hypothetical protein